MPSRAGNWLVAVGILVGLIGLCILPAAFGEHGDNNNLFGLAGSVVGMGALAIAGGLYLNAQALKSNGLAPASSKSSKRPRGACDLCHEDMPVVNCKVHQFHLCGKCLAEHYDFRSCVYVPSTRRTESKSEKAMSAKSSR